MSFFIKIKNKLLYEKEKLDKKYLHLTNVIMQKENQKKIKVMSIDQTLDKISSGRVSVSRFGDGEFKVINGEGNGFQEKNEKLAKRLSYILKNCTDKEDFLVCIPNIPAGYDLLTKEAHDFWYHFMFCYASKWIKHLNLNTVYGNAHVTRLYYDWKSKDKCCEWFEKIKKIWNGRDILIVEGEKSRLGVGNDLFSSCTDVKRILCPNESAFDKYDSILSMVQENCKGRTVLIALGQTASVLAYDLYKEGIVAIDIGHIDVEYEWMRMGATKKVALKNKYVKEVENGNDVEDVENPEYLSEIICKIQ